MNMSHTDIKSLCTAWREDIRRVWQVPSITHSAIIPGLCDTLPFLDMFYMQMFNFVYKCCRSESYLINFTVQHGILLDRVINETLHDETETNLKRSCHEKRREETETFHKYVSRRPRPRRSSHKTETF